MKIRPVGAELFHADKTDGQTWRRWESYFAILLKQPKIQKKLMENLAVLELFHTDLCMTATGWGWYGGVGW